MKRIIFYFLSLPLFFGIILTVTGCKTENGYDKKTVDPTKIKVSGSAVAELTAPPNVPKPVGSREATKLTVNLEIKELESEMTDGVKYIYRKLSAYR